MNWFKEAWNEYKEAKIKEEIVRAKREEAIDKTVNFAKEVMKNNIKPISRILVALVTGK